MVCREKRRITVEEGADVLEMPAGAETSNSTFESQMSHSLNSLKGAYTGDYIGDYYRGY